MNKIQYLTCNKNPLHQGQFLTMVCLNSLCTKNRLLCPLCLFQNHNSHPIIPLKFLLNRSHQLRLNLQKDSLRVQQMRGQIDQGMAKLQYEMNEMGRMCQIFQNRCQDNMSTIFFKIIEQIKFVIDKSPVPDLTNKLSLQSSLHSILSTIHSEINSSKFTTNQIQNNINSLIKFNTLFPDRCKPITNCMQQLKDRLQRLRSGCQLFIQEPKFGFNNQFKHHQIQIEGNQVKLFQSGTYHFSLAIITPSISFCKLHKNYIFQIVSSNSTYLSIGVCSLKTIQKKAFLILNNQSNHGAYMMSSNGTVWNCNQPAGNTGNKSFGFNAGDKLMARVHLNEKRVVIQQCQSKKQYQFLYQSESQDTYFCVGLWSSDAVKFSQDFH